MTQDEQHLDTLALFHYIVAAITALFACIPMIHVAVGVAMLSGAFNGGKNPPPPSFGWLFVITGSFFILCGWAMAVLIFLAGRRLKQRRSRTFCLVIGALECMFMPFGTILGIFTIVVLMRDSVRILFEPSLAPPIPPVQGT